MEFNNLKNLFINEFDKLNISQAVIQKLQIARNHDDLLKAMLQSMLEVSRKIGLTAQMLSFYFPNDILEQNHVYVTQKEKPVYIKAGETGFFFGDAHGIIGEKDYTRDELNPDIKAFGYFFEKSIGNFYDNSEGAGYNTSQLNVHDTSYVKAYDQTKFCVDGNAQLNARGQARGKALQESSVLALNNTFIEKATDNATVYLFGQASGIFESGAYGVLTGQATCLQMGYNTCIELYDNSQCISIQGGKILCQDKSHVLSDNIQNVTCIDPDSRATTISSDKINEMGKAFINGDRHVIGQTIESLKNESVISGYKR